MLTACFKRQSEFVGCFLEMLSVDGSADADFDSWTKCLDVRESGDAIVVDLALQQCKLLRLKGGNLDESILVEEVFCSDFKSNTT